MNAVKKSDIDFVMSSLTKYIEHIYKTKLFIPQEMFNVMEPVFTKAGYRQPPAGGGQNILILTGAGMGDFIVVTPTIREIRRIYPNAHITLLVIPGFIPLAETCPYVDELVIRPTEGDFTFSTDLMILPQLLEKKFDIAFSTRTEKNFYPLMYMSGAKLRIALDTFIEKIDYKPEALQLRYFFGLATQMIPAWKFGTHAVDMFLSFVDYNLQLPVANRELELWSTLYDRAQAKNLVQNLSRPVYALMTGCSSLKRRYPAEKYARLVERILSEEPTATFINMGGGQADMQSAQILKEYLGEEIFNKHVINLVNRSNMRLDAAILKHCDMYIGNNTGTLHLASTSKCPVLVAECFPADLESHFYDIPRFLGAYRVPSVSVQPKHALPECANNHPYNGYGCRSEQTHCIAQIEPETLFKGFKLLKEIIAKNTCEHLFIS